MHQADVTREDWSVADACKRLADAGADVVGLNCIRGPATMMPLLREIRAAVKTHMAALPVPYRTTRGAAVVPVAARHALASGDGQPAVPGRARSVHLQPLRDRRVRPRGARRSDIRYLGVCCGAGPHHIRALAEVGRQASAGEQYSPDMSKHAFLGSHERIKQVQKDYADKL